MVCGYKDSREPFRTLLDTAHDAIFLMRGGRFIDCNPRTLSMFGCGREDIIGQPPDRFSPELQPDGRSSETAAAQYIQAAIGGEPMFFEWVHCRLDGHVFDAEVSLNGVQLKGEPHLLAVVRDITGRKQAERDERIWPSDSARLNDWRLWVRLPAASLTTSITCYRPFWVIRIFC